MAVGVVFSSFSSILIRISAAPPLALAAYRLVFTVILVAPMFLRERLGSGNTEEPHRDAPSRAVAILLSAVSGVFLALHFGFWITSLSYTSVANSTVLVSTHPIVVALAGAVLLGDRVRLRSVTSMVTAIGGSVLLVAGDFGSGESQSLGNLLAFLGAVSVSGYIIAGRVVRRRLSVSAYTLIVYSVTAALLVGAAWASGAPLTGYPIRELAIFAALALFCTVLGHSLFSWALKYVRPTFVSTSTLGEPVIAATLALVLLNEVPTVYTLAGGAVTLASIYLFARQESKGTTAERQPEAEAREEPSS